MTTQRKNGQAAADVPRVPAGHSIMTRRDLLAHGFMSSMSMVAAPSLLSLLYSRRAYGACDSAGEGMTGGDVTKPAIFQLDLAGGSAIHALPTSANGSLLSAAAYATVGVAAAQVPNSADTAARLGGMLERPGQFTLTAGMRSVMSADTISRLGLTFICNTSNDDNNNNPWGNITRLLARVTGSNTLAQVTGDGNNAQSTGNYAVTGDVFDPAVTTARINNVAAARAMVQAGLSVATLGNDSVDRIIKAIGGLSDSAFKRFSNMTLSAQLREVVSCGNEDVRKQLTQFNPAVLDPATDALFTTVFGAANVNNSLAAGAKVLLDGYTRTFTHTLGGYDYHQNNRAATDLRDFNAGQSLGRVLEVAARKNREVMFVICTDGGVSGNGQAQTLTNNGVQYLTGGTHQADNGARSGTIVGFLAKQGRTAPMELNQIGEYNDSGAVNTTYAQFSGSPVNTCALIALQALALEGKATESELVKAFGSNPFGADIGKYVAFGKRT